MGSGPHDPFSAKYYNHLIRENSENVRLTKKCFCCFVQEIKKWFNVFHFQVLRNSVALSVNENKICLFC